MVTIKLGETEYSGETMKEAQAAMRRGQREAKKLEQQRLRNYATARERAESIGYRVLARKLEGAAPCAWRFYKTGDNYGPNFTIRQDAGYRTYHDLQLETEWGRAESSHYGYICVGHVWNGGGFSIVVFFRDNMRPSDAPEAMAVGVCEDQIAFVPLHGISPEWFAVDDEERPAETAKEMGLATLAVA